MDWGMYATWTRHGTAGDETIRYDKIRFDTIHTPQPGHAAGIPNTRVDILALRASLPMSSSLDVQPPNVILEQPAAVEPTSETGVRTPRYDDEAEKPSVETEQNLPPVEANARAQDLATAALRFLSTATPTTLAGIAGAFSAITYALLGKFGLLVIGAVGGVVAFASLEVSRPAIGRAVRGEKAPEVLERLWLELQNTKPQDVECNGEQGDEPAFKAFDDFRPETRESLTGLVDAIIRDYINSWYGPMIPSDHSFPLACRKTVNSCILAISNRISRKRPADSFLDLLTNCSSIIIALLSELSAAFADLSPDSNMTAADAVYNYLATNPESRLANLLNQRQQAAKFKMVAEDLLGFLDRNTQNCDPARIFLRESLANSVLETALQTCSKAEWINSWIVYLLEAGEPDINHAIDVGMQTGRDTGNDVFIDLDGNLGNIGIAKPKRPSADLVRRKESMARRKKLGKADEKLEEVADDEVNRVGNASSRAEPPSRDSTRMETPEQTNQSTGLGLAVPKFSKKEEAVMETLTAPGSDDSLKQSPSRDTSSSDYSSREEDGNTPGTPRSAEGTYSPNVSPRGTTVQQFTSFDQIVPPAQGDGSEEDAPAKVPLTLYNAAFTLSDDSTNDSSRIRTKPTWDYLIQVEPSSASYPGWMIVRRYSDFETLHEIVRRIATISGATAFTELHRALPNWKIHTRESLRGELERYLRDACWYRSLAESEGMKRFLEKSQGHTHTHSKSFGWETVGKNMLDVLATAPKGAMEGGKSIVGNVSGVFGSFPSLGRKSTAQSVELSPSSSRFPVAGHSPSVSGKSSARSERASSDSQRSSVVSIQPAKMPPMDRRPSCQSTCQFPGDSLGDGDGDAARVGRSEGLEIASGPTSARPSRDHSRASSLALRSPESSGIEYSRLPPPPDEMASDYEASVNGEEAGPKPSEGATTQPTPRNSSQTETTASTNGAKKVATKAAKQYAQMSEQETRVAVELLFAVINEMYTLSSAWNIRRTLLAAAKSFLLRPGNPSLLTVQSLIQSSVLDANTSDAGVAASLRKLRENTMPTEQELAGWPAELTAEEKEKLAVKARRLLIQSGVPTALMGVMGQAATGEALGRVFDCLQIEEVARGMIFGLILQAVRVLTH
ncbi:PX domain-containing protein [Drechmeria coniospora]|uniref:PX domain-containing protein n=1 Tax=Drechmeria coniospora TaxID=98403 RepID=A0A151GTA3_DRECN|nr:PX domain-containing protein [Drechmeria coniospora]KYK60308.1 PX domain-containing protein [Drechmeria coniospora]